jgi:hypothetical protein
MAERKHNWMWRRLEEREAASQRRRRTVNYRRPDFMTNAQGQTVRQHCPHPTKPVIRRFFAMTQHVEIREGDPCLVWKGGDTFKVDADTNTVTTPARFYWEWATGEKLKDGEVLYRTCKTPRCVKHKVKR